MISLILGSTFIVLWLLWAAWVIWGPDWMSALIERAKRTPYYHLDGYMLRHWVIPYRNDVGHGTGSVPFRQRPIAWLFQRFDVAARVHEILCSDNDPHPHSHPWGYVTCILPFVNLHGYWESRYNDSGELISTKYHGPGSVLWRRAGSLHKLEMSGPVYTLFITFKKRGTWGFNVKGKLVPWREYLGQDDSVGRP